SGEQELLDLGVPISTLDGQRVVLEEKETARTKDKSKSPMMKSTPALTSSRSNNSVVITPLISVLSLHLRDLNIANLH
ncbi:hypothetical protein GDO78_011691, partial [Eleutherodactylus coqui]